MKPLSSLAAPLLVSLSTLGAAETNPPFRPAFIAIHSREPLTVTPIKWTKPIYNLVGWKRAEGTVERDIFKVAEVITLALPNIEQRGDVAHWKFVHEAIELDAELSTGKLRDADVTDAAVRDLSRDARANLSAHCE